MVGVRVVAFLTLYSAGENEAARGEDGRGLQLLLP